MEKTKINDFDSLAMSEGMGIFEDSFFEDIFEDIFMDLVDRVSKHDDSEIENTEDSESEE